MALIVTEHAGKLGRAQVAMQPGAGPQGGLTVSGTSAYTVVGSGAGPAFLELYAHGSPHYFTVTGGAGRSQYIGQGERVTYGFHKGTVITVTDENGGGGGLPEGDLFYFKPTGSGAGDGSSINDARTFNQANLDAAATAMAAVDGTIVLVGPLTSKAGSAARGADEFEPILGGYVVSQDVPVYGIRHPLNPDTTDMAYPCFAGDRFAWELPEDPEPGEDDPIFDTRLQSVGLQAFDVQADGAHFRYLRFRRTGCAFRWSVDDLGHDALIEDFRADNIQRFVDPYTSAGVANTINNITVRNGTIVGYSKAVIRSAANSSGMLVEDVYGDSGWQAQDSFARLFNCDDTAHDIIVRRCHALHIYSSLGGYWNGDGFESNDGNEDITFEDCSVNGSTDGGFDTKGKRITIINGTATDCKRLIRVWMTTTVIGGTFSHPKNRGDYGNGSCLAFINGGFSPAQVTDPLAGSLASEFRGKGIFKGCHFVGDGDTEDPIAEEDGGTGRQASMLVFTGAAGAIAKFINCTRTSDLNTGGVEVDLTAEVADGQESIALRSFVSYYTGPEEPEDPGYVPTVITTDLTQDWPEGSLVVIELKASQDGGVTDNELCTWELDRTHPDVDADETIALSDWAYYAPEISFIAPDSGGAPVTIDVTVEDAAANPVTGTLVVTSTPRGPTDPPVYAGAGALAATGTLGATSVTPPLPRSAGENDVIAVVAHTNKTLNAPSVSGISDPPVLSILQSGNIKSHLFIKRLGVGEVAPVVTFDTAIAVEGDDEDESDTEIHAARCFLIRGCRLTGDPYEAEQGAASTLTTTEKTGPAVTPVGANRLIMNFFVINNDVVDVKVTAGGMTKASYGYTTLGSDLCMYACSKRVFGGAATPVDGATIEWGFQPATQLDTTSQNFGLAFLPEIDP